MISSGKKIGIDAGSAMVKLVEIAKDGDGMALANFSFMSSRLPPSAAPDQAREVQAKAIDAAIKKCECKCRDVVVGVPGNSAFIRNIKLPPVPTSKIDQIVRYEVQQTIPFPIENIALDYQVLEPDESSEVEVIMVAMKGEVAENFIKDVEQAKVKVGVVDSIPLALYNCYRYNGYSTKDECTAIMEIGAETSNILIELGGELRYCRSVSIGGNDITNAIAKELNIPFQQAERIKMQHGLIIIGAEAPKPTEEQLRVSGAITGVLERLLGEIKLTIGYFRSLTGATAISRAVLAGGGAMMKNIRPFLADRLGLQVEILNPFRTVNVPKSLINAKKAAPMFATAVGLALRSSQDCCQLKISLIPPKVKEEKSRKMKMALNAASFVLVLAIIGAFTWRMLPEANERAERIAMLDAEIARYAAHENSLKSLRQDKEMLLSEYKLYSRYTNMAADPVVVISILADSLEGKSWIESVSISENAITVQGSIKSETKLDALRQLSQIRTNLEKYCDKVTVRGQGVTQGGEAAEEEAPVSKGGGMFAIKTGGMTVDQPKKSGRRRKGGMFSVKGASRKSGSSRGRSSGENEGIEETEHGLAFGLKLEGLPTYAKFMQLKETKAAKSKAPEREAAEKV